MNWNLLTLIIATLSLVAAVILPFAQKKYEESKSKFSFRLYIKEQLGYLYNLVTYDKIEYIKPTISDTTEKELVTFSALAKRLNEDFVEHQNSLQPRIIFHFISNLQKYCFQIYQIRYCIAKIDTTKLKENILANGEKLSRQELKNVYGLLVVVDNFSSISLFHDRFGDLKSVQRAIKNDTWIGLKVNDELLGQQQKLAIDLKNVVDNRHSLNELLGISFAIHNKIVEYYGKPGK